MIKQGGEGTPLAEICGRAGISQATYLNWKKKCAGLLPSEMQRLRELEDESGRRLSDIVAMDNLSSDKHASEQMLIEAAGASLPFLPPYSHAPQGR